MQLIKRENQRELKPISSCKSATSVAENTNLKCNQIYFPLEFLDENSGEEGEIADSKLIIKTNFRA